MGYTVLRDTKEQKGWVFPKSVNCDGTLEVNLPTGDYTLSEFKETLCIERKGSSGEFAQNVVQNRFERELVRMESFAQPFIVLEFTIADIINFPKGSGIPPRLWPNLKITSFFLLKRLIEFQFKYKTKIILAGKYGKEIASSIFKRMIEHGQVEKRITENSKIS